MLRVLILCSFLGIASLATAVPVFPGAKVAGSSDQTVSRYRLVLSELKHIQGNTFGEQERRLSGQLQRVIYDLPQGAGLDEVSAFFASSLADQQLLYRCDGIDCGSSHFWANDIFSEARLVSRDKEQAYFAALTSGADRNQLTIVYISQRGGRQGKVLVDTLLTTDPVFAGAATREQIRTTLASSSGWLPGMVVTGNAVDAQASAALLQELNGLATGVKSRLNLVLHCYRGAKIEDTLGCSENLANSLREQLDDSIHVYSAGALLPAPEAGAQYGLRFTFWPGR